MHVRKYLSNQNMRISEDILNTYFTKKSFRKNEFLIKEGDFEDKIFYIQCGAVRFATNVEEERAYTFDFGLPGDFVNAYDSYKNNCAAAFSIQALTAVEVFFIESQSVESILGNKPEFALLIIEILEQLLIKKTKREIMLIKYAPQEIYNQLIDQEPELFRNIPLKYIASYMGITPQALSRIRKRIS